MTVIFVFLELIFRVHTATTHCTYLTRFLESLSVSAVNDINLKQNGSSPF